ncbi:MAG TPA: cupredoxin domain-containing protein [Vicinamibacterales bacterium]|nr:cupredoxin domain-containing protein [Vicinamibacterales bacterium]
MRPLNRMGFARRRSLRLLSGLGVGLTLAGLALLARPSAQDQAPERHDLTITAKDFRFSPNKIEVSRDDLLRLTVKSEDVAYGFTIDDYRVSKRVPAGGSVVLELRADREGTFPFYSNMTSDSRHQQMRGELVVRKK